jgi:hypothetical protein
MMIQAGEHGFLELAALKNPSQLSKTQAYLGITTTLYQQSQKDSIRISRTWIPGLEVGQSLRIPFSVSQPHQLPLKRRMHLKTFRPIIMSESPDVRRRTAQTLRYT